jgi:uncharacterized membrane protein YfcA
MSPGEFSIYAFLISLVAGLIGSLLGVGGGIVIVPGLTLLLGIDIKYAVAASIVGVVATSTGSAASYVKEGLANIRLGMFLEVATVTGALMAAYAAGILSDKTLYLIFACLLAYSGGSMLLNKFLVARGPAPHDPWADKLQLHDQYLDKNLGNKWVPYTVHRTKLGLFVSFLAGLVSGLLGVGGGILKVPAMHVGMRVPIKPTTATSNFTMGVTAAASAIFYFSKGMILPVVVAPVAVGVLVGATVGSLLLPRVQSRWILSGFTLMLICVSYQMFQKGLGM